MLSEGPHLNHEWWATPVHANGALVRICSEVQSVLVRPEDGSHLLVRAPPPVQWVAQSLSHKESTESAFIETEGHNTLPSETPNPLQTPRELWALPYFQHHHYFVSLLYSLCGSRWDRWLLKCTATSDVCRRVCPMLLFSSGNTF